MLFVDYGEVRDIIPIYNEIHHAIGVESAVHEPIMCLRLVLQNPVGVREVDVVFSFFVVGTRKIYFVMNLIVQNLTNLAVTPTGVWVYQI